MGSKAINLCTCVRACKYEHTHSVLHMWTACCTKEEKRFKKPKQNKVAESIREIITSIHKAQREAKLSQSIQDSLATS